MSEEIYFGPRKYISVNNAANFATLSRDYISRLCRSGQIRGRRIGKSWYVDQKSLEDFIQRQTEASKARSTQLSRERSLEYRTNIAGGVSAEAVAEYEFEKPRGERVARALENAQSEGFISAYDAAAFAGVTRDYVTKLVRSKKIRARRIGKNWYVNKDSLQSFLLSQEYLKSARRVSLAHKRSAEYRAANFFSTKTVPTRTDYFKWANVFVTTALILVLALGAFAASSSFENYSQATGQAGAAAVADQSFGGRIAHALSSVFGGILSLLPNMGHLGNAQGTVTMQIQPYHPLSSQTSAATPAPQTVVNNTYNTYNTTNNSSKTYNSNTSNPAPSPSVSNGITEDELNTKFNTFADLLRGQFTPNTIPSSGGVANNIALSQVINDLTGTHLHNVTVNGISGLTAADIPHDITASNYLAISGGTLTGALVNTSTALSTFAGGLSVDTLTVASTTATSTFANGINVLGGCLSVNGTCITSGIGGVAAGGQNGQIQFNNGGTVAGASNFSFNSSTGNLGLGTTTSSARFTIAASSTDSSPTLLSVASSSGTLFSVDNTGLTNFVRASGTSATTTTFFSTTSSSTQTFSSSATFGNATINSLTLGSVLSISNGGTGTTSAPSYGKLLIGNGAGGYNLFATSTLALNTDNLVEGSSNLFFTNSRAQAAIGFGTTSANTWSQLQIFNGGATTTALTVTGEGFFATASTTNLTLSSAPNGLLSTNASGIVGATTFSGPLSFSGGVLTLTQANGSTNGFLSSGDWTNFNNKVSSTSLSATYPLTYNSSTGVFATSFGTTTNNIFSGTNTFNGNVTLSNATSTSFFSTTASSTNLFAQTASLGSLGLGTTTPGSIFSIQGVGNFTTATSTLTGGLNVATFNVTGTASSTFAQGINIAAGCFAVNGICLPTTSSIVSLGAANTWTQLQTFQGGFISQASSTVSGAFTTVNSSTTNFTISGSTWFPNLTNSILSTDNNGKVSATTSIGVNYLTGILGIANGGTATSTQVTNGVNYFDGSRITSGTAFTFTGINLGIGTTTPGSLLSLNNIANFTTATSTFYSTGGINLQSGCYAVSGTCLSASSGSSASSTLLSDNNTFSGNNIFGNLLKLNSGFIALASSTVIGNFTATATSSFAGGITGPNNFIVQQGSGNVGIGTNSPNALLSVIGQASGTIASSTLTTQSAGWAGFTMRQVINSGQLSNTGSSKVSVTIYAGTAGLGITNAYIGEAASSGDLYDFASTPVPLTFNGGSASATVGSNGNITSDVVTFTVVAGENLIVSIYTAGPSDYMAAPTYSGWQDYYKNANDASTVDTSGYTTDATEAAVGVSLVQATGTASTFNVHSNGSVGVGVASPLSRIDVAGGAAIGMYAGASAAPRNGLIVSGDVGIGTASPTSYPGFGTLTLNGSTGSEIDFQHNGSLYGFVGVDSNSAYLGGGTGRALDIYSNDIVNAVLATNGNLGIGTSTPGSLLAVQGVANFTTATSTFYSTGGINLQSGCYAIGGNCLPTFNGTAASSTLLTDNNTFSGNNIFSKPLSLTSTTGTTTIASGQGFTIGGSQLVVQQGSGNVGIGTNAPGAPLSISGGSSYTNIGSVGGSATFSGIAFGPNSTLVSALNYSLLGNGTNTYLNRPSGGTLFFAEGNNNQMVILPGGNLGLGTTTPGSIFSVQGVTNFTAATSTFSSTGGINLTAGCFAINNTCVGGAGGSSASSTLLGDNNTFSGTNIFNGNLTLTKATTTNFAITGLTNSLLSTNANGSVVATTSIGANYLTGTLATINSTGITAGGTFTITAASSTLLIDNNTFSGNNIFSQPLSLTSTTGTTTIAAGQGFTIGGSQFVLQQGSGFIGIGTASPGYKLDVSGQANISANSNSGPVLRASVLGVGGAIGINFGGSQLFTLGANNGLVNSLDMGSGEGVTWASTAFSNSGQSDDTSITRLSAATIQIGDGGSNAKGGLIVNTLGIGTTTPFGKFAINLNSTDAAYPGNNAFVIASSTASATTTLFSVSNTGQVNQAGVLEIAAAGNDGGSLPPALSIGGDTATGWRRISANQWQWVSQGSSWFTLRAGNLDLLSNANLNIGTGNISFNSDASLSHISAGVLGFGTGSVGSTDGGFLAASSTILGNFTATGNGIFGGTLAAGTTTINSLSSTNTSTSTFAGGLSVLNFNQTGNASSTFAHGINIAAGCLTYNGGACIGVVTGSASSTLLTDNNTFSGTNIFSGTLKLNGGIINYGVNSTSTIPTNTPYAWTIATTTTGLPLIAVNTTSGTESVALGYGTGGFVTVDSGVNLGLGTTTPGSILSVQGVANFTTATSTFEGTGGINLEAGCFAISGTCLSASSGSSASSTLLSDNNTFSGNDIFTKALTLSGTTGTTTIASGQGFTIGSSQFVLQQGSGNVGIGTNAPGAPLSISGGSSYTNIGSVGGSPTFSGIAFGPNSTVVSALNYSILGNGTDTYLNRPTGGTLHFAENNSDQMVILPGGNLGLGSTTPGTLLSVGGNAFLGVGSGSLLTLDAGTINHPVAATSTIVNNTPFAWTIATTTTGLPLIAVNTKSGTESVALGYGTGGFVTVDSGVSVGVGSTTPWQTFSVEGGVALHGLATGAGNGALCLSNTGLVSFQSAAACTTSSQKFKNDIQSLAATSGLAEIMAMRPVSFFYKQGFGDNGAAQQVGFIAEEMNQIDPRLVVFDASNTPYSVQYANITSVLAKAVQQLNGVYDASSASTSEPTILSLFAGTTTPAMYVDAAGNVGIGTSTATSTTNQALCLNGSCITSFPYAISATSSTTTPSFAADFLSSLKHMLVGWFADAGNGIADLFVKDLYAENVTADNITANKKLCVGTTCVTPAQFQAMVAAYQSGQSDGATTSVAPPASPAPAPQTIATSSSESVITSSATTTPPASNASSTTPTSLTAPPAETPAPAADTNTGSTTNATSTNP